MWFNNREQKQGEVLQIELARDWTRKNTPLMLMLIEDSTHKALGLLAGIETDAVWDFKRLLSNPNPHQRPVCHSVIDSIPESALAPGMIKQQYRKLFLHTDHMDIGYTHSDIMFRDIHIDPTFGQFFPESFKWLLNRHAKLFQNGILVAGTKDIKQVFNIKYE